MRSAETRASEIRHAPPAISCLSKRLISDTSPIRTSVASQLTHGNGSVAVFLRRWFDGLFAVDGGRGFSLGYRYLWCWRAAGQKIGGEGQMRVVSELTEFVPK